MTDPKVPPTSDAGELTGYAAMAAELRRIADALDKLPPVDHKPYVTLSILPEKTAEAVDTVALAVLGKTGQDERISGDWYHVAKSDNYETGINVHVAARIPAPPDERDVELERLRAELAALRPADADHGRTTAVAEAKPDTLGLALGRAAVLITPTDTTS